MALEETDIKHSHFRCNMVALKTIATKEIIRFMRIWSQTLLPSAVTMTLYFIIFGNFIGKQIKKMDGFDYISFIVPGLIDNGDVFCTGSRLPPDSES